MLFPALLLLIFPTLSPADNTYNIVLITSSNSSPYVSTAKAIKKSIPKSTLRSIQTTTITIEELYALKNTLSDDSDLLVPIGQRALKETLKYSGDTPVLASLISIYSFDTIIQHRQYTKKHLDIGAIYIDQPLNRHLLFSRLVLPDVNRYGIIVSSGNKSSINKLNSFIDNDTHHIEILNPGDNVISTLSRVLEKADAIIALPDPIVFNLRTTRNILLSTYRKRTPVIGFSKSYAKAGALAAIYSTPELIGKQTGEYIYKLAKQFSLQNRAISLSRTYAKYFSISVNNRVSRSLGLPTLNAANLEKDLLHIEKGRHE